MDAEQLKLEVERLTQERDEARDDLADATIDTEEIERLRAEGKTDKEALEALTLTLAEADTKRAKHDFETKRDKALVELGMKADDPAVALAFPDSAPLDDAVFDSRVASLKLIVAKFKPEPPPDGDDDALKEWQKFHGAPAADGGPPEADALSDIDKRGIAAREKFSHSRNPRDLVGAVVGKIMKMVGRTTPGEQRYYEAEEVKQP